MYDKDISQLTQGQTTRRRGPDCASDLALDRLELGELASAEAERLRGHLTGCEGCRGRAAVLEALPASFAAEHNLAQLAADALARAAEAPAPVAGLRRWLRLRPLLGVATACAALSILVLVQHREPAGRHHETTGFEPTGIKGSGFTLSSYVKHVERPGPGTLHGGESLHPGDKLQFRYNGGSDGYLAIVSVDSRAKVSVYYPTSGDQAARVDHGRDVDLASAVELDDTLGNERIIAVRCASPVAVADVVTAARQAMTSAVEQGRSPTDLASLGLPCVESRLDIVKALPGGAR